VGSVVLNGVFVGLVYGLLGLGLVTIYRSSRIINFAYGETGMLAAFVFFDLRLGQDRTGGDHGVLWPLLAALVIGAALGAAMEFFIARPIRDNPTLNGMVATIAASLLFITFATRRRGVDARSTVPMVDGAGIKVLGLHVSPEQLLIGAVTVAVLVVFGALYRYTSFGLRLRVTALDPYAAALVGVNTNRTSMASWAMAGALSAVSAVLIAPLVAMNVLFMTVLALRGFAAALVGGLTSLTGAFVAGILLGVGEGIIAYKSPVSGVTDVVIALGLVVLIVARPGGLVRAAY
jgi:branched-chain amino acid transport system permease protein